MASEIRRPVRAAGYSDDYRLLGADNLPLFLQSEASEAAACINLGPELACALKGLLMCSTDTEWAEGLERALRVLAEWDKAVGN